VYGLDKRLLFGEMAPWGGSCENSHPTNYQSEGPAATERVLDLGRGCGQQPALPALSPVRFIFFPVKTRTGKGKESASKKIQLQVNREYKN
jgi:hypothetical protein